MLAYGIQECLRLTVILMSIVLLRAVPLYPRRNQGRASRRPEAVYTSTVGDAGASTTWDTISWSERGRTGDGETLYDSNRPGGPMEF